MKTKIISIIALLSAAHLSAHSHEAHVHGEAELEILFSQESLELELTIPGMDFCGFEHSDLNSEENRKVEMIIETLHNELLPPVFLNIPWHSAKNPSKIEVIRPESHEHHDEGTDEGEDHEGHSEYKIRIYFDLTDSNKPKNLDFENIFKLFESLNEIDWVLLTENGQKAGQITPRKSQIRL